MTPDITVKDKLNSEYEEGKPFSKIVLATRMPDGSKEIMINDNVDKKIEYINNRYDRDLRLLSCLQIHIEEYLLVK